MRLGKLFSTRLVWVPEGLRRRQERDWYFADKPLQPRGTVLHSGLFRRGVAEEDQGFGLALCGGIHHPGDGFPFGNLTYGQHVDVIAEEEVEVGSGPAGAWREGDAGDFAVAIAGDAEGLGAELGSNRRGEGRQGSGGKMVEERR